MDGKRNDEPPEPDDNADAPVILLWIGSDGYMKLCRAFKTAVFPGIWNTAVRRSERIFMMSNILVYLPEKSPGAQS